ncbi:MAG TPA: ricin-type beta-trefoil lectin domain protein, partial [Streptomyces sp.]
SKAANPTLTVDLGSAQTVGSFVVKHAGLGGENTSWNTGAFQIQTSTDNSTWSTAASVTGNRSSRTYSSITPRQARYVRLAISSPTNNGGDTAARIYELEVYGQSTGGGAHAITGLAGKCVDIANSGTTNGTHVQLYDCNGTGAQQWTVGSDGTVTALGKCLDDASSGTADGTLVQLWDCNGTNAQKWTVSGKQLINTAANKCLDVPGSNTANGTQLDVWTCNGGTNQQWSVG